MLNNISWASYIIALSIFLCIYYGFVLIMYYRHDLKQCVQKIKNWRYVFLPVGVKSPSQRVFENDRSDGSEMPEQRSIPELLLELQSIISNGASRKFPKEELLLALRLHLKRQAVFADNSDKETINNFIKAQCEYYCSIHLSGEEELMLWVD
jgi:hypothetical protein